MYIRDRGRVRTKHTAPLLGHLSLSSTIYLLNLIRALSRSLSLSPPLACVLSLSPFAQTRALSLRARSVFCHSASVQFPPRARFRTSSLIAATSPSDTTKPICLSSSVRWARATAHGRRVFARSPAIEILYILLLLSSSSSSSSCPPFLYPSLFSLLLLLPSSLAERVTRRSWEQTDRARRAAHRPTESGCPPVHGGYFVFSRCDPRPGIVVAQVRSAKL